MATRHEATQVGTRGSRAKHEQQAAVQPTPAAGQGMEGAQGYQATAAVLHLEAEGEVLGQVTGGRSGYGK